MRDDEWRWRPLHDTFQGCFLEEELNGTVMFVNLTQVNAMDREGEWVSGERLYLWLLYF